MTNNSDKPEAQEIDCLEAFDHLYSYLNGELTNKIDRINIEHHISHCKSCYSRSQMEKKLNKRIKESGKSEIPESIQNRLNNLIEDL